METRRRQLLVAAGALLAQRLGHAQQPQKMRRIGYLALTVPPEVQQLWRELLCRAGYEEGRNLTVEWRSAEGQAGRLPALADELARLNVELIVAILHDSVEAAKRSTQTIPIVMFATLWPVERGLIKTLARPGSNVTGTVWWADPPEALLKQLQIIKDAVPNARRLSTVRNPADPIARFFDYSLFDRQANAMGLSVERLLITQPGELKSALERIPPSRPDVLWVAGNHCRNGRHARNRRVRARAKASVDVR